jgi:O-antigen biosynthesis protein WbqP
MEERTVDHLDQRRDVYRRALDVAVSAVLALLVLPLIVVAALGSAVALRAWPFFVQDRVGRDGNLFRFVTVRTLPTDVPRYTDKHQLAHHHIPAFCRFLRTFHLDELPQVFLVLSGRMSLVGPRPEMAELHDRMPARFARERTTVRPGCTGLWQISHACTDLIGAAPEFDRFYLAHRTVRLDLWVLARTALQMTGLGGLVSLDDVPQWALPQERGDLRVIDLTLLERSAALADEPLGVPAAAGR